MRAIHVGLLVLAVVLLGCESRAENAGDTTAGDSASPTPAVAEQGVGHSDTLHVYVHHVKAGKEAAYERWVREVWMPSIEKAGQKYPEVRRANEGQRLFAPTKKRDDGSSNYVWLFEPAPPRSPVIDKWVFPDSFLVAAGYTPADAEAQSKALSALITTAEGGEVVRKF